MKIGKVIGNLVSVSKISELKPVKLFIVQILDSNNKLENNFVVAIDSIGVGFGDSVIITEGSGSRLTMISKPTHTDATIVARVDDV